MSKSIYKEAQEDLILFIAKFVMPNVEEKYLKTVKQALDQAQKQDKLLELYKELATIRNDMLDCCEIVDDGYYDMRDIEVYLERQIKELENNEK